MESTITDSIQTGKGDQEVEMKPVDIDANLASIKAASLSNVMAPKEVKRDYARVIVPSNRMKPLRESWTTIAKVLVEHMKIQIKMNLKKIYIKFIFQLVFWGFLR